MSEQRKPLEEIGDDWFVNRHDELELYWQWATNIPKRAKGSYALIGLRRTGKTAILRRLFNRLFNEQAQVLPVYISFARYLRRPKPIDAYQFAEEYFTGLVRSYLAFRYRETELLNEPYDYEKLLVFAQEKSDPVTLKWFHGYEISLASKHERTRAHNLMQWVINFPKGYARGNNQPMAMIVDEFQVLTRVYNPDDGQIRNLTDSFQEAAETRWAPLLVAGSSVAMMVDEALTGLVSGRFRSTHLGPLTQEFAYEMIFRLGQHNNITITEELALAIWELTRGYPYPIQCLLNSGSPDVKNLPALDALQQVLLYELTNNGGALFAHYDGEYGKYIRELNGEGVTRRILLWSLQQPPDQLIFPDRVAEALQLPLTTVLDTLGKLQRTDVLQRRGMGSYWGPTDPMLRRYLEFEHYVNAEHLVPEEASKNLLTEYRRLQGETNRKVGHLAEIIVGGVMRSFDGRTVDGATYFNAPGSVTLYKFDALERRGGVIKAGVPQEIDLIGEWRTPMTPTAKAQRGVWLVSVRHRQQAMGESQVQAFLAQTDAWLAEQPTEQPFDHITRWYVSKLGFTQAASALLQAAGVYHSDLTQFNQLAQLFDFLPLTP